jgi:hypothetical protein
LVDLVDGRRGQAGQYVVQEGEGINLMPSSRINGALPNVV